jgi:tetratricopeptide (TPR) repeat protein
MAKRIEDDQGLTATGAVMGTPSYMAPEQATGSKAVGPAADVYALGAILYEALTGRPPLLGATALETLAMVLHDEPLPPRQLQPGVPRDLETICLKCLHKPPNKRYAIAGELAADLRRFLAGEPIHARPTPAWERAVKWVKRKPTAAALLAVIVQAALVLLIGGLAYNKQLRKERDEAEQQRLRAETNEALAIKEKEQAETNFRLALGVVDGLSDHLQEAEHRRPEDLRKELLELALSYYQKFVAQRSDDPALRAASARAYLRLAQLTNELGDKQAQVLDLGKHALAIFEELHRRDPNNAAYQRGLGLACYYLGRSHREVGQGKEGRPLLERALEVQRKLRTTEDNPDSLRDLARTCYEYERLNTNEKRKPAEVRPILREGLACLDELAQKQPLAVEDVRAQGHLWERLGNSYLNPGDYDDARHAYTRALELRKKLADAAPGVVAYQSELARNYFWLGMTAGNAGRLQDSNTFHRQALLIREKLARDHPAVVQFAVELGMSYRALGNLTGAKAQAEKVKWYDKAVAVLKDSLERKPGHVEAHNFLSLTCTARARSLARLGNAEQLPDQARTFFLRALTDLETVEKLAKERGHETSPLNRLVHGIVLARLGRHDEAIEKVTKRLGRLQRDHTIDLARMYTLCARAARADTKLDNDERKKRFGQHTQRAMNLLRKADDAGLFPKAEDRSQIREDPDFQLLRSRKGFRDLFPAPK